MADYIYLLEQRLSLAQRAALISMRNLAAENGLTLFLVGGAVRDLTTGSPVRDLDFVVQGNALGLRQQLEAAGITVTGAQDDLHVLYLSMPGGVRAEVGSTLSATYPKPGKPVFQPSSLGEDLRRRDFTANAMALSLNGGSYGLLIDPLNGIADIENRQLRLVSNYGFIEEPVRLVRAARFMARLGWTLEEKTQTRYETAQAEDYIAGLDEFARGYELEEILHEEDPLRVLKRLEAEGWMKVLAPFWVSSRISTQDLEHLRETQMHLQEQGITVDSAAAVFPLLTAKFSDEELASLKAILPRRGFVREVDGLEAETKEFVGRLVGKAASAPSAAWKLITSARGAVVLQAAFGSKSAPVQAKFQSFFTEWPQARQRIPHALMQEMRIGPEMDGYADLVEKLFFALMDGQLTTPEETRAFLEPYSPPAPPPPVNLKRTRTAKKESKTARSRGKKSRTEEAEEQQAVDLDEETSAADGVATPDHREDRDENRDDARDNNEAIRDAAEALDQVRGADVAFAEEHEDELGNGDEVAQGIAQEEEADKDDASPAAKQESAPSAIPTLTTVPSSTSSKGEKSSRSARKVPLGKPGVTPGKSVAKPAPKPVSKPAPAPVTPKSPKKAVKGGGKPLKAPISAAAKPQSKSASTAAPKKAVVKTSGKSVVVKAGSKKSVKQAGKPAKVAAGSGNGRKPAMPSKKAAVNVVAKAVKKVKKR